MRMVFPLLAGVALLCAACPPRDEAPAVARGRQVYMSSCTACHNMNPTLEGPVGPAVKGASRELLEAKVLRGEYPPGYQAKRDTRLMPPTPHLEGSVDDLAAFLAAF